jgi:hypothetical protein
VVLEFMLSLLNMQLIVDFGYARGCPCGVRGVLNGLP